MDFLDPKKKRSHRIRLFIGYGLMAIAIGIATTILAFEAQGFDVDRRTGSVFQNGLIFVDAHPESAEIYLNGEAKGSTDARMVVPEGRYTVELRREGYRPWERAFRLLGSDIQRLVYPFMFPIDIEARDVELFAKTPALSTQSPDRRWLVMQTPGPINEFLLYDLADETVLSEPIEVTPAVFTNFGEGTHSLTSVEWSRDNRHVVLKHTYDKASEFIVLDIENPDESININTRLSVSPTIVSLRDKKFDQLYVYTAKGGVLQIGNLGNGEVTPLLKDVISYHTYSTEEVLYVTKANAPEDKVNVNIRTADQIYKLRELPAGASSYMVDISKYDGAWLMVAAASNDNRAYVYKNPFDVLNRSSNNIPIPETVLKTNEFGQFVRFSANVRFVSLQSDSEFSVYDFEDERLYRFNTKLSIAENEKAYWMDGHRLTLVSEGRLYAVDFDGSNLEDVAPMTRGHHEPYFDRDYDRLYTLRPSTVVEMRPALVEHFMRIETDR